MTSLNLTKEQTEQLYKLLTPAKTSVSFLAKGTVMTAHSRIAEKGEPRIIDSKATDHMTCCEKLFYTYTPSIGNHKVKISNKSLSVITSILTIKLSPTYEEKGNSPNFID